MKRKQQQPRQQHHQESIQHQYRSWRSVWKPLVLGLTTLTQATGQVVGEDVFICSPSAFTFTLDFTGTCPGTVVEGGGIDGVDCFFVANSTSDLVPVSVDNVQVLELSLGLENLNVVNYPGRFEDGESIEYSSVSMGNITDLDEVPGGLQLNVRGTNAGGRLIQNSFIVSYTNDGAITPIFDIGDQIGWIVFSDFAPARPEYCPAATLAPVTMAPVQPVTTAPITESPVTSPPVTSPPVTLQPVAPVTSEPTTKAPATSEPTTKAPATPSPTKTGPVMPTFAPISPITASPVFAETPYPTFDMSFSFEYSKKNGKGGKKAGSSKKDKKSKKKSSKDKNMKKSKKGKKLKNEKEGAMEKGKKESGSHDYFGRRRILGP